ELLRKIILIQEEERKRIARGLHDEISQSLTGLAFNLEAVLTALPEEDGETRGKLEEIKALSIKMLEEIHRVIYQLRPSLLDDLGLVAAVEWLADNYLQEAGITVFFKTTGTERTLAPESQIALFRIAQEAITNIVRHSSAESVSIAVEFKKKAVAIHIEDDGKGFNAEEILGSRETDRGLGLLGMKERAELLEGRLSIDSSPGRGTKIDVELPS
ncbi:MAG: sensor histidine kinase, partial [Chloroflexi bacterium]|nr:sensor histidine kinase [Chloroflexota bacterium]